MRRTLVLLSALILGAGMTASAQARTHIGARLQQPTNSGGATSAPPSLVFSVRNLLDDPEWLDVFNSAYRITLHWKVTLNKSGKLFDQSGRPREWDDYIQKIPTLDLYNYSEPSGARLAQVTFSTVDSLKEMLAQEQLITTSRTLPGGKWYYSVELTVSVDERQDDPVGTSPLNIIQRIVLGSGPKQTYGPQTTATFVIPDQR